MVFDLQDRDHLKSIAQSAADGHEDKAEFDTWLAKLKLDFPDMLMLDSRKQDFK